jgi:hypothetical protein
MKYKPGDMVMLSAWEDEPRQRAQILTVEEMPWGMSYIVQVKPEGPEDDGLRELTEDQIEGFVS